MDGILRFFVGFLAITSVCIKVADASITLGTCQLSCSQNENQLPTAVGPQGPPGKRGPVGADGRPGPSGPTGPPGVCNKCDQLEEKNMNLQRTLLTLHERLYPQDCIAVKKFASSNGIYLVYPSGGTTQGLQVYCDQFTDNGGWIVMQRRIDGSEDFYRDWDNYVRGFGDKRREFWLGLETVYFLTVNQSYEVRFDFVAKTGEKLFAKYSVFKLASAGDNYRITVTGYSGDAGDSMRIHNQRQFTTKGRDHDTDPNANDAEKYKGAWWYTYGHHANLNGLYSGRSSDGLSWYKWKDSWTPFVKAVEIKIRRIE